VVVAEATRREVDVVDTVATEDTTREVTAEVDMATITRATPTLEDMALVPTTWATAMGAGMVTQGAPLAWTTMVCSSNSSNREVVVMVVGGSPTKTMTPRSHLEAPLSREVDSSSNHTSTSSPLDCRVHRLTPLLGRVDGLAPGSRTGEETGSKIIRHLAEFKRENIEELVLS
jgi:hypothetical protein